MLRFRPSIYVAGLLGLAALAAVIAGDQPPAEAARKRTPMIRTVVKDSITTRWTIDCVPRGRIDVTKLVLSEAGWKELMDCIGEIERVSGVKIVSNTIVRRKVVVSDVIRSSTALTGDDVAKLKGIIETHRLPGVPVTSGKPRIECERKDGVLSRFVIDPGDGRLIDVLAADLPANVLEALFGLVDDIEEANGTHVSGETRVRDGETVVDRVISLTYLDSADVDAILQIFQSNNIQIPPNIMVLPLTGRVRLKLRGERKPRFHDLLALVPFELPNPATQPGIPTPDGSYMSGLNLVGDLTRFGASSGGDPVEATSLNYQEIEWTYQSPSGPRGAGSMTSPAGSGSVQMSQPPDLQFEAPATRGRARPPLRRPIRLRAPGAGTVSTPPSGPGDVIGLPGEGGTAVGTLRFQRLQFVAHPHYPVIVPQN